MTTYDFKTGINRLNQGSYKWIAMAEEKPDISSDVYPLSVADLDMKHPPELIEGLKTYLDEMILGYTQPAGSFYDAVIQWMEKRHDWKISRDWILHSSGIVSAIYHTIETFTQKGDGVMIMPPVYYPFSASIENTKRKKVENPLIMENGRYTINFPELEKQAEDENTKLLLFCSPHNPVGRVWTKEELERLVDICLKNDILILSDEIHFDLIMPGHRHTVLSTISEKAEEIVITATAPSKSFNIAGLQTSNIIIPNADLRREYEDKLLTKGVHGLNALGPKACELCYTNCEGWLGEFIELIHSNHLFMKDFFEKNLPELHVFDLEGTFLQWVDFSPLGFDNDELEKFLKEDCEIFLDEGYIFGEQGSGFERFNIGCPRSILEDTLIRLLQGLRNKEV